MTDNYGFLPGLPPVVVIDSPLPDGVEIIVKDEQGKVKHTWPPGTFVVSSHQTQVQDYAAKLLTEKYVLYKHKCMLKYFIEIFYDTFSEEAKDHANLLKKNILEEEIKFLGKVLDKK